MRALKLAWRVGLFLGLALASVVFAQSPDGEADLEGDVIVTGDRRERRQTDSVTAVEVVRREEIVSSGARNAAEVLETQPGVEIRPALRGRQIRLQGLDPQYVLILIDGERVSGRVDNVIDLTRIKAEEIERIEIVKGPSSALYGSDAIGGVINIITRESTKPFEAELESYYGSGREANFGSGNETHASGYVGLNGDFASSAFTLGWHRSDGYDLTPETDATKIAEQVGPALPGFDADEIAALKGTTGPQYNDLNFGNRSRFKFTDDFLVRTHLQYRYLDQERVDVSPPRQVIDRSNETHDLMAGFSPVYFLPDDGAIRVSYNHSRYSDTLVRNQRGAAGQRTEEIQDDRIHEGKAQLDYRFFEDHMFTFGADGMVEELITPRIRDEYAFRQRVGLFFQDEWDILGSPRLTVTPGVRYDDDSQFGSRVNPKLAVRFDPTDRLRLRAGGGTGYRAPSFKDLYLNFQNPGVGYEVVGNPDLRPEYSTGYNAGIEYEPTDWLWLSVNAYHNRITNLIDFTLAPDRPNDLAVFQPQNIKEAYTRGVEASVEFRPLEGLLLALGYTATDTRDLEQDIPLEGRAKHRGSYRLEYEYLPWGLGFSVRGSVFSKQAYWRPRVALVSLSATGRITVNDQAYLQAFLEDREVALFEPNPDFPRQSYVYRNPYHILDLRVFKRLGDNYELFAGVDNALDEYDLELNPERPKFYYFGLRVTYAGASEPALP